MNVVEVTIHECVNHNHNHTVKWDVFAGLVLSKFVTESLETAMSCLLDTWAENW